MAIYRVQLGDTPMSIATRFTGEPTRMSELVEANADRPLVTNGGWTTFASLVHGDELRLPSLWEQRPIGLGFGENQVPTTDQMIDQGVQAGIDYAKSNINGTKVAGDVATGAIQGAGIGTMLWPGVGTVIGAIAGAFIAFTIDTTKWLSSITSGSCTITIYGQDTACSDYPANVAEAARWLGANAQSVINMTPDQYAQQTHILTQDFGEWVNTLSPEYRTKIAQSLGNDPAAYDALYALPGSQTLLRLVQIPMAAATAAAFPTLLPLFRFTLSNTYPALTQDDINRIAAKVEPLHAQAVNDAIAYFNDHSQTRPAETGVHQQFPDLLPVDVKAVVDDWKPTHGTTITIHGESATGKLATGAVVAAGLTTAAIWGYSAYRGVTFLNTAKSLYGDVVKFFKR
jgi:hypothetical protein